MVHEAYALHHILLVPNVVYNRTMTRKLKKKLFCVIEIHEKSLKVKNLENLKIAFFFLRLIMGFEV